MKQYVNLQVFRDYAKVRYYTFHKENDTESESIKFFNKFKNSPEFADEANKIANWLVEIGIEYGALPFLFRFEDEAAALPPDIKAQKRIKIKKIEINSLRLYCIWISEEIVILANGDLKISRTAQESPVKPYFSFAKNMGKQINRLIADGSFKFVGKEILDLENIDLTI